MFPGQGRDTDAAGDEPTSSQPDYVSRKLYPAKVAPPETHRSFRPVRNRPAADVWLGNRNSMNGGKIMIRISGCTTAVTLFAALAIAVHLPVLAQADGNSDSHNPKLLKFRCSGGHDGNFGSMCTVLRHVRLCEQRPRGDRWLLHRPAGCSHASLRTPEGRFTSFNVPGDGEGAGLNQGTVAYAVTHRLIMWREMSPAGGLMETT